MHTAEPLNDRLSAMQGNVGCGACDPRQSRLHVWNPDTAHSGWRPGDLRLCCLCQALLSTLASDSLPSSHVSVRGMLRTFHALLEW